MRIPVSRSRLVPALLVTPLLLASGIWASLPVDPLHRIPESLPSGKDQSYQFEGLKDYTWPLAVATDARGNTLLDHVLLQDEDSLPRVVEQLLPFPSGEPNLAITSKGNLFMASGDRVQRSMDGGRGWEAVYELVTPNYPTTEDHYRSAYQPLWVDPVTDRIFFTPVTRDEAVTADTPWCSDLAYSDDEGETWTLQTLRNMQCDSFGANDYARIWTAPRGPKTLVDPSPFWPNAYPNVFYYCTSKGSQTWCATSYDGGVTFAHSRSVYDCRGDFPTRIGFPAIFPDGTLAVPICGSSLLQVKIALTQDNGLTWQIREPAARQVLGPEMPSLTVTPNGIAYYAFRGENETVQLLRSRDKFQTWEGPFRVSPLDHTLNLGTGIASGDDGRIVVAYLGAREEQMDDRDRALPEADRPTPSAVRAVSGTTWHLFVTLSFDADAKMPTFVTQQVTPDQDPVWIGRGVGFFDLDRDEKGRFYASYHNGCTPRSGCSGDPESQAQGGQATIAVQTRGLSLFADQGVVPTWEVAPPVPSPR